LCALTACTNERPQSQSVGQSKAEAKSATLPNQPGEGDLIFADGTGDASAAAATDCDASLWTHGYNPDRLKKLNPCIAVTGTVAASVADEDGDQHFLLMIDRGQENLLSSRNEKKKGGFIVVEIVCANPARFQEAKSGCAGYTNRVALPSVDEHVRVTGTYVLDSHNGWAEIHPASRIDKL
jgi:hypothetical protein